MPNNLSFPILGIDYGEKNLGVAIAHTSLAQPLEVVHLDEAFDRIQALIDKYQPTAFVIGLSEGRMAETTKRFAQKLAVFTGLPYFFQDETLSSYDTRIKTAKAGFPKKKREGKLDHYVAAAILQDFIDSQVHN